MYACACGIAILSLSVALVTVEAATSQNEINYIAGNLQIDVYVGTMHESGQGYDVTITLTNEGQQKILSQNDWSIEFCMKGANLLSKPVFENGGLQVESAEGCTYVIRPSPKSNTASKTTFIGLTRRKAVSLKIQAVGLSLFKYDVFPRFVITAPSMIPKNIESTNNDTLNFVHLAPSNTSEYDFSRMTGIRRSITAPTTVDLGRVPGSIVIPSPKSIQTGDQLSIDLSQPNKWYIWPDNSVSTEFKNLFVEKLSALPNMTASKFEFVTQAPPESADRIYLQIANKPGKTQDGYTLAVVPRPELSHMIHISATSSIGLQNALESMLAVTGLFNILPAMTIDDDARFGVRSVMLDVTKNFFPPATIKKFIALMKKYKLNNLVLKLADDYAWRLEMPSAMDFEELITYASKRCANKNTCLPHAFGSGASEQSSGSGFYSIGEFINLLEYAHNHTISITPLINVLGGIRSAKLASHKRYERVKRINTTEADRLHLMTPEPTNLNTSVPRDMLYTDGLLDPCNTATMEFIKDVIVMLKKIYTSANVPLQFHAGGDEMTNYFGDFPSCKKRGWPTSQAMRNMLKELVLKVGAVNATLRVRQDAVIDPDTKICIDPQSTYNPSDVTIDFWQIMPGNQVDWGLSEAELKFINDPVPPPNVTRNDPMVSFPDKQGTSFSKAAWSKQGVAPWARAYKCANDGYKVVLGPESFFSLDSAYELDFNEKGNRKIDRYHIINPHRMMMFEPLNLHTNMDTGNDGYRYLPYRLCHIYDCTTLLRAENIVGLQASVETDMIRTENDLWESILPELLLFAEKSWREAPFENILKAEQPLTLINVTNIQKRAFYLNSEIINFTNCFGYKESGILDFNGYSYRVSRPGAHIDFRLPYGELPPYPVIVNIDVPGADIEYRISNNANSRWELLFVRDEATGIMRGGYNMSFPVSNEVLEIRTRSTDGQRWSIPTLVRGGKDVWPKEVPVAFRERTCLPMQNASMEDYDQITIQQWRQIFANVPDVLNRRDLIESYRVGNITNAARAQRITNVPMIFMEIQLVLEDRTQNITALPATDIRRIVYLIDKHFSDLRFQRLERMEQEYQNCKNGGGTGGHTGNTGSAPGNAQRRGRGNSNQQGQGFGNTQGQGFNNGQGQGQGFRNTQSQGRRGVGSRG